MAWVETARTYASRQPALTAVLAAAVIGAVLVGVYLTFLDRPYGVLFTNLRPADAATIVASLDKKKTPYRLKDGGATILAPRNVIDSTRLGLMSEDLPLKGTVGFELFNKSDMGLTEFAQRINYQRALQGELERTIMTVDGVESARVHLALAEPTIFRDDRRPSKASVSVVPRGVQVLAPSTVRGLQRLIAAATPDLSPEDVVVLDQHGAVLNTEAPAPSARATPLGQEKQAVEDFYAAKVRVALAQVTPEAVDVTVSAGPGAGPPSPDGADEALEQWSPASRHFPLSVALGFPALPSPADQDRIRAAAARAAGLSQAFGDQLVFETAPLAPSPDGLSAVTGAPAAAPATATSAPALPKPPILSFEIAAICVLAILLAAAVLLHRGRPRGLTARQRGDYVRRLQALLEGEEANAAPRP